MKTQQEVTDEAFSLYPFKIVKYISKKGIEHSDSNQPIREAYILGFLKAQEKASNKALVFAEWIDEQNYFRSSNDLWYIKSDGQPELGITTYELYQLFLNKRKN